MMQLFEEFPALLALFVCGIAGWCIAGWANQNFAAYMYSGNEKHTKVVDNDAATINEASICGGQWQPSPLVPAAISPESTSLLSKTFASARRRAKRQHAKFVEQAHTVDKFQQSDEQPSEQEQAYVGTQQREHDSQQNAKHELEQEQEQELQALPKMTSSIVELNSGSVDTWTEELSECEQQQQRHAHVGIQEQENDLQQNQEHEPECEQEQGLHAYTTIVDAAIPAPTSAPISADSTTSTINNSSASARRRAKRQQAKRAFPKMSAIVEVVESIDEEDTSVDDKSEGSYRFCLASVDGVVSHSHIDENEYDYDDGDGEDEDESWEFGGAYAPWGQHTQQSNPWAAAHDGWMGSFGDMPAEPTTVLMDLNMHHSFTDGKQIYEPIVGDNGEHLYTDGNQVYAATCVKIGKCESSSASTHVMNSSICAHSLSTPSCMTHKFDTVEDDLWNVSWDFLPRQCW